MPMYCSASVTEHSVSGANGNGNRVYTKSKQWLQKLFQSHSFLSFDFNMYVKQQAQTESERECECGTDFCEGIVCKQKPDDSQKKL
jgi:hypothetical protein